MNCMNNFTKKNNKKLISYDYEEYSRSNNFKQTTSQVLGFVKNVCG